jgi:hypothetical protein
MMMMMMMMMMIRMCLKYGSDEGVVIRLREYEELSDQLCASSAVSLYKDPSVAERITDGTQKILDGGGECSLPLPHLTSGRLSHTHLMCCCCWWW